MLTAGVLIAGKYRVIKKLGEGAMGSVWLARNEVTDREFAIKVLLPEAAASSTGLARFLREAKVCGALRHPSILEIYDAGEAPEIGGAPYLVMERLDGAPLDAVLRERGALPPRLAVDVLIQISRGLQLAHAKGIVHRDLKPANVFLHGPGTGAIEPKVLDFGISKVLEPAAPEVALTHTSAILGSPIYMSPEQMGVGNVLDARSDVHALGILLWECLTGRPPFTSTSYNLLVVEIIQGPRPRLRDAMRSISKDLAFIVERAFAIDPKTRFPSAAAFADALEEELVRLGGGMLGARTAFQEVLGTLNLESKPPPRLESTTNGPISIEPEGVLSPIAGTLLSRGSSPQLSPRASSGASSPLVSSPLVSSPLVSSPQVLSRSPSHSSPDSFARTELAPAAVSGPRDAPRARGGAGKWIAAGVFTVAVVGAGAVAIGTHRAPPLDAGATSDLPAGGGRAATDAVPSQTASASAPTPTVSAATVAPVAPVATAAPVIPASSASATLARPLPAVESGVKKSAPRPRPAASVAPTARPRIDQSGL